MGYGPFAACHAHQQRHLYRLPRTAFGDWSNLVPGLTVIVIMPVTAAVIILFFRHHVCVSAYEYFGKRSDNPRAFMDRLPMPQRIFPRWASFSFTRAHRQRHERMEHRPCILAVGAIRCYTLVGGIEAVIWADVLQGFVLWAGLLVTLGYLLFLPAAGRALCCMRRGRVGRSRSAVRRSIFPSRRLSCSRSTAVLLLPALRRRSNSGTAVLAARSDRDAARGVVHRLCFVSPCGRSSC